MLGTKANSQVQRRQRIKGIWERNTHTIYVYGELQFQRQRQSSGSASCSSLRISLDLSFVWNCSIYIFFTFYIFFLYNFVAAAERKRLISAVKKTKDSRKYGDHAGDSIKLSLAAQNVLSTCGQISDCIWYLHSGDSSRYIYTFFGCVGLADALTDIMSWTDQFKLTE